MKPLRFFVAALLLSLCVAAPLGCQRGVAPVWSTANPQKSFDVGYDPWSGTYRISGFANDGTGVEGENLELTTPKGSFKAKKLVLTERSVENRDANADQMKAGAEMTKAAFDGAAAVIGVVGKAFAQSVDSVRRPPEAAIVTAKADLLSERTVFLLVAIVGALGIVFLWKRKS